MEIDVTFTLASKTRYRPTISNDFIIDLQQTDSNPDESVACTRNVLATNQCAHRRNDLSNLMLDRCSLGNLLQGRRNESVDFYGRMQAEARVVNLESVFQSAREIIQRRRRRCRSGRFRRFGAPSYDGCSNNELLNRIACHADGSSVKIDSSTRRLAIRAGYRTGIMRRVTNVEKVRVAALDNGTDDTRKNFPCPLSPADKNCHTFESASTLPDKREAK